nr:DUF3293 domain-containing protein [uncultured Rhodopila sp.]
MTGATRVNPSLCRAYRMTRYTVDGITVRIGRRSAGIDRLLRVYNHREGAFVTAYNPFSRRMPPGWNRRMQTNLVNVLAGRAILPATGCWRRWCESHVVVFGSFRRTLVLARRYRQHGIVIVRLRQPARLVYTSLIN